jgi:hypothetical protein
METVRTGLTGDNLRLLEKHISKDSNREAMRLIRIDGADIVTTDGKRLARITPELPEAIPSGVYRRLTKEKIAKSDLWSVTLELQSDVQYPEYKQVIRHDEPELCVISLDSDDALSSSKTMLEIFQKTKRALNVQFLEDITTKYTELWTVYGVPENPEKPLFFIRDRVEVVLLPFKFGK